MAPRKAKSKNYFTKDTENAIMLYNSTSCSHERSKIYEKEIHYPFFKLTQNIIHTFKFYHTEVENLEHLQHEIEVFLLEKMQLFHPVKSADNKIRKIIHKEFGEQYSGSFIEHMPENEIKCSTQEIQDYVNTLNVSPECYDKLIKITPAKAYSYFGTIVKRWCILYNEKNYKKKISSVPVGELEKDDTHSYSIDYSPDDKLSYFIDKFVEHVSNNIYDLYPKNIDAQIADSILELFRKRDSIDVFNKKALYIYIHEMLPDVKTPKITKIANSLYGIFRKQYIFYIENGYINF
jgi:hypothetical protein